MSGTGTVRWLLAALVTTGTVPAFAGEEVDLTQEYVPEEPKKADAKRSGVDWRLNTGLTLSLANNRNVVGQPDGSTIVFGYKFEGGVDVYGDGHELRNSLNVAASITQTPLVGTLTKASDDLMLESIYLYHVVDWFGPFVQFKLSSTTLPGMNHQPEPTTYLIENVDGSVETRTANRLFLTDALMPMRLKESAGGFFQPIAEEPYSFEFRLGAGARETFAEGQRTVDDDDTTPEIEVKELDDVFQFGVEAVAEFWGAVYTKRLTYKVGAEAMIPFANNQRDDDDRNALDLTNVEFRANLSVKLVEWASLDYQFKTLREPQLIDEFQIQNNLVLTASYTFFQDEEPKK